MELERRVAEGLTWGSGARVLQQVAQFAAAVVLARLLTPLDFGLVGMALAIVGFCSLITEFGLGAAIVQHRDPTQRHLASAFWLSLTAGATLAGGLAAAAPAIADFYGNAQIVAITRTLALSLVIASLGVVPRAILQRTLSFAAMAKTEVAAAVVAGALAAILALAGAGFWSIVAQVLASSVILTIGYAIHARWRPSFALGSGAVRELAAVSAGIAGFNAVNHGARNLDDVLVGRVLGAQSLGIYGRAYTLMLLPVAQAAAVTGNVLLPALASARTEPERARQIYLRVVRLGALLALPMLTWMLVVAESLVPVLFGPGWTDVVPLLRILCLVGCIQVALSPVGWIYQAFGATSLLFRWGAVASALLVACFAIGVWIGSLAAVAWSYFGGTLVLLYPGLAIPGRLMGLRPADMLRDLAGPAGCAGTMAGIVWAFGRMVPEHFPSWGTLAVQLVVGIAAYLALVAAFRLESLSSIRSLMNVRDAATTQTVLVNR